MFTHMGDEGFAIRISSSPAFLRARFLVFDKTIAEGAIFVAQGGAPYTKTAAEWRYPQPICLDDASKRPSKDTGCRVLFARLDFLFLEGCSETTISN